MSNAKQHFLNAYDREHATTMKVLRAYPEDQLDLKPHPRSNSARDLAWVFVMERGLGTRVWNDAFAKGLPAGSTPPKPPDKWSDLLAQLEQAHAAFREVIAAASDEDLQAKVHFLVAPKTMGEMTRLEWIWFLLHDQIHHRGQLSVYLRMAGGQVPSIYGPSADEPWT
jgi:uncharacterized damage-inducible protein DinB